MKTTQEILARLAAGTLPTTAELVHLLGAQGKAREQIYRAADQKRREIMGNAVHLRGIIEFSNICRNNCWYCGIRCENRNVERYRMSLAEIVAVARDAQRWGYGTVVLQSGADPYYTAAMLGEVVQAIKRETALAVTLSVGVRPREDLAVWQAAGCDRYLLRFETRSNALFSVMHPDESFEERLACLTTLRELGYQVGSGFMIGLPGSTPEMIANDILFATSLKLDMIGCGPFLAHPETPLASKGLLDDRSIYYKAMALLRLLNPQAHIPATTAFDALEEGGRDKVLARGANVFMPNLTPAKYRERYQLYPNKPCVDEDGSACALCVQGRLAALGRCAACGPGHALNNPPQAEV